MRSDQHADTRTRWGRIAFAAFWTLSAIIIVALVSTVVRYLVAKKRG